LTEEESLSQYRSRLESELELRRTRRALIQDEISVLESKLKQERMALEVIQGRSSFVQLKDNYRTFLKKRLRAKRKELLLAEDELSRALERFEAISQEEE
jgi:hypothetical protein